MQDRVTELVARWVSVTAIQEGMAALASGLPPSVAHCFLFKSILDIFYTGSVNDASNHSPRCASLHVLSFPKDQMRADRGPGMSGLREQ